MTYEVDPVEIKKRTADDRGRVTIGAKYANQLVTVAIVEVEDDE